jgi:hypothetical protein
MENKNKAKWTRTENKKKQRVKCEKTLLCDGVFIVKFSKKFGKEMNAIYYQKSRELRYIEGNNN